MDFTPHIPSDIHGDISEDLIKRSEAVIINSARLTGNIPSEIIFEVKQLLRKVNSYYSNRIESEGTGILGIDEALTKKYSNDSKERSLQILAVRHIETQKFIEDHFSSTKEASPFSKEFMLCVHEHFYGSEGMEPFLKIDDNGTTIMMTPGALRNRDVYINKHAAPSYLELDGMLTEFSNLYEQSKGKSFAHQLIYILSSHHRLTWIHPFLDGNGRVSRLLLDGAFISSKIEGYGIWNISRGLARTVEDYKESLRYADTLKLGSKDGKGYLSSQALERFVEYMLDTAMDQITFMRDALQLETLASRIEGFVALLDAGMLNEKPLPNGSLALFKHLLLHGCIERGQVGGVIGRELRTGSKLISTLEKRGYLTSDTPKGKIRIKFNAFFAKQIFPDIVGEK